MTNEQLAIRIKAGENVNQNILQLYEQTKAYIHIIAERYHSREELEDLEQEGFLALYAAIDGYDPDKGVKFLTYAKYHICLRMQRYIQIKGSCLRLPVHRLERIQQYKRLHNSYMMEYGVEPSEQTAARHMRLTREQIQAVKEDAHIVAVGSLNASLTEEEEITLEDTVPCNIDLEGDVLEQIHQEQLQAVLWPMVDALPGKQGKVIRMRYQEGMTLKEAGQKLGINTEAARQWEAKGMRRLRSSKNTRILCSFLPETMECMAYHGSGVQSFQRTWTSSTERTALELLK